MDATSQEIDSAQAHLDFDPSCLTVVDEDGQPACEIIPGTAFPQIMQNMADNELGRLATRQAIWFQEQRCSGLSFWPPYAFGRRI